MHFGAVKPYGKNRNDNNAENHFNSNLWANRLQLGEWTFGNFAFNEAMLSPWSVFSDAAKTSCDWGDAALGSWVYSLAAD